MLYFLMILTTMVILMCSSCRSYSYIRSSSHFMHFQSKSHVLNHNPYNFSISLSSGCNFIPHHMNIPTPFSTPTSSQIDNTCVLSQPPEILTSDYCNEFIHVPNTRLNISLDRVFYPPGTDITSFKTSTSRHLLRGSNIVVTKGAMDSSIQKVEFVKSSTRTEDCPSDGMPEFAVVGRSNVGKSSLLNSLFRRKRLALTSKKPGKTQCINHFRINDRWYFVDLPGYGYASAPKTLRFEWQEFTKDYFLNRSSLVCVFLLVDANVPTKDADMEYAIWLGRNRIPMTLIFTKCDKRKNKKCGGRRPEDTVKLYDELLSKVFEASPPWIMTSSVTHQGRDEMLIYISQLRNYWLKH